MVLTFRRPLPRTGLAKSCRLLRLPYGDQAIFARRPVYETVGGFPPCPGWKTWPSRSGWRGPAGWPSLGCARKRLAKIYYRPRASPELG